MSEIPPELARSYASLLRDMHLTLLSEIGARSAYDHLCRCIKDAQLARLLEELNLEGAEQVARLQELMPGMRAGRGGRALAVEPSHAFWRRAPA
ncbi:MAG: hypothetical protein GY711_19980 [bacterium]|nr:hypothetical protein [bacterium]